MSSVPIQQLCVTRRAPAKINLALAVGPRDETTGLHPICSWFAAIDLVDELTVTRLESDRLSRYAILWHEEALVTTPIDWSITKDLAVRAHRRLEEETMQSLPVQLKLQKRIPVGGGLGGGSSDAAAMLLATRELFELEVHNETLARIALELGSDVPFFLHGSSAIVEGIGDEVHEATAPGGAIVLIVPEVTCSTADVYREFDCLPTPALDAQRIIELTQRKSIDPEALFNDLSQPALRVAPELAEIRKLAATISGECVHITGSGSAMFILCPGGMAQAQPIADRLSGQLGGCSITAHRFID